MDCKGMNIDYIYADGNKKIHLFFKLPYFAGRRTVLAIPPQMSQDP
jgi:hypothetical protein